MRVRTAKFRRRPEIDAPAWIGAPVERFCIGRHVLRQDLDTTNRPTLERGNIDVEQAAVRGPVGNNLGNNLPRVVGGLPEVERPNLSIFQGAGDTSAAE